MYFEIPGTIDTTETLHNTLPFLKSSDSKKQVLAAPRLGAQRYLHTHIHIYIYNLYIYIYIYILYF